MDFRTIIVEVSLTLFFVIVMWAVVKGGARFVRGLEAEMEYSRARKLNLEAKRRVLELVGKLAKNEIEQVVFECWRSDCSRSHESLIRCRFGSRDDHKDQLLLQKICKQHEETLNRTRMELKGMSQGKLLEFVNLYMDEWIGRRIDPCERMREIITSAGILENNEYPSATCPPKPGPGSELV